MSIIVWIVIGGLAGWIASLVMKSEGGLARNIVVGIVGALIGGFAMSVIGAEGFTGFNLWSFFVALVGSIIVLGIAGLLTKDAA